MNFQEYQELSRRTMPAVNDDMAKCNYAMGLAGESSEVVDLLKKWIHHKHPEDRDKLVKELGDALHYLSGIATMYDITMDEVATENIMKLAKRYPNGFNTLDSLKRVDTK